MQLRSLSKFKNYCINQIRNKTFIQSFENYINPNMALQLLMFDNFVEETYHPYDQVYTHPQYNQHIFIGDAQSALDMTFLSEKGIKTVVTAARDMDHITFGDEIKHIVYPLFDGKQEDIAIFFDNFYEIVEANIKNSSILVHCAAGISRSSTLVISYIMKKEKMTFKDAIAHVRKARPSVLPNLGFERQLKRYEEDLRLNNIRHFRNLKPKETKINQSGKSHMLFKTELIPVIGAQKLKQKMMSANVKQLINKITEKDMKIIRTYNHSRNDSKNKKFIISKKSSSFTKHYDDLKPVNIHQEFKGSPRNINTQDEKRPAKTPFSQMKEIYLPRKHNINFQKRFPTERGHTFYNIRGKPKGES